jgi:hypothetical protein
MEKQTFRFDFAELNLNTFQINKVLGYNDSETSEMISGLASEIYKECLAVSDIKAEYRIYDKVVLLDDGKSIQVEDQIFNVNKIVYNQLKHTESLSVFLCTAGQEIGLRSRRLMKDGDLLKGYIYDVTGSEIVSAAAISMHDHLKFEMNKAGKKITNRYSPGYCGWDVAEQHKLFSMVPDNFCGIKLTESALMDPVKSISGFIGIGERVIFNQYTCSFCENTGCLYRNAEP